MSEGISERVGRFFDQRAQQFHRIYQQTPLLEKTANRVFRKGIYLRTEMLENEVRRLGAPTVLDVGSGTGVNAFAAIRAGASRVLGVDLATNMIDMARAGAVSEGFADRTEFVQGDFVTWESPEQFDVVTALGVFDYVARAESFYRKMLGIARKSVVASFPSMRFRGLLRKVRYELQDCPLFLFEEQQIQAWTEAEGFRECTFPCRTSSGFVVVARR
ncbi:MAG: class I SAM-dependent methyltransferase [Myxococcales bacterium]